MEQIIFNSSKKSYKKFSKVQKSIDRFLKKHPNELSEHSHKVLRKLLRKRANILSKITRMNIHSISN